MPSVRTQYVLAYGLVAITGIEYFYRSQEFSILLFLIAGFIVLTRNVTTTVRPLRIIVAFFLLELVQALYFNNFVFTSLLSLLVKLFLIYFVVQICGIRLIKYYTDIMYVSALLALPIYFLTFIPAVEGFLIENVAEVFFKPFFALGKSLYETSSNIIIYTFNPYAKEVIIRNSGPFWEPGAFAVFLNLALIFNLAYRKTLLNRQNNLFIISIITTFSTAGYVTLFIILIGYVLTSQSIGRGVKAFYVTLLLFGAISAYDEFAFLGSKIQENISLAKEDNTSRFGSAYLDIIDIIKNPLIGYGRRSENRFGQLAKSLDASIHRNNGVTFLMATYGVPAAILYFITLFAFVRRYCRLVQFSPRFTLYAFIAIMSAGFSQGIFDRALLLSFLFLADRLRYMETATARLPLETAPPPQPELSLSEKTRDG
ncbi:hypothetical protein GCM10023189_27780 [Nibrella saemangeumensis]|uniref:O-Antigen ligase n=1 Tax=Nibrella saemangeumensis TaxID=1084526 RepID=A0ABP8MY44_9BACT